MFPSRWRGSTKWSQEYRSPVCSSASATAARLGVDAEARRLAHPVRERDVEHLHEDGADVAAHPLLEHVDEEVAPLLRADRAGGDELALLLVERPVAPRRPRLRPERGVGDALDDRDELDEPRPELVAEEAVDLGAAVGVAVVDGAEDVELDAVLDELAPAAHHLVEAALAALVDAVGVVDLARPVDREPDEEVVLLQELAPLVVELRPVRLDRVGDRLFRPAVLLDELDRAAEELDAHQRRLPALPGDRHLLPVGVRLEQLPDVGLEQVVGHPEAAARVQHLLREEEAVRAVEVADGPGRLREQMERVAGPACSSSPWRDATVSAWARQELDVVFRYALGRRARAS